MHDAGSDKGVSTSARMILGEVIITDLPLKESVQPDTTISTY